ncbi:hypothetical protein [Scytonema sp. NUACC26]|uniref:hypothetical protein n=1 Tax=Scytonema sp. NUACC26 TaxID=3140176 RepID=UPI0034DC0F69
MQLTYKFKLCPGSQQLIILSDWQHKVGYIQNRSLEDRIWSYSQTFVMGNYCDLYTKREVNAEFLYCDIATKSVVSPLYCSVNKSVSLGSPWKEDNPKLRRGKKDKPFNPKRSAYEMHSSWVTDYKKQNPEYKTVSADVIQQALRHVDKAVQNPCSYPKGWAW